MVAIATSASELPHVNQQLVVPKNNRTLRPLFKRDMDMVTNTQHHPDLILETNLSGIPNSLTGVVNFRNQFKDDKFKHPKAHPTLSLHSKFRNAEAKRAQPHWRTLKKAPLKEVVQTSVMSLLNKAKPLDALTLTPSLVPTGAWYFGTEKKQLLSSSILNRIHSKRFTKYLMDRDKERHTRANLPPKWQYYNIPLTAKLWGISTSSTQRYQKNRLIFDKHCHQGNMAKKVKNIAEAELATNVHSVLQPTRQPTGVWNA